MDLSLLCVTQGAPRALPFLLDFARFADEFGAEFICVADGDVAYRNLAEWFERESIVGQLVTVHSQGYLESVLDDALAFCHGHYVLRMDDDEKVSPAMKRWLGSKTYLRAPVWSFARPHFWPDEKTVLVEPGYFPDLQTRLTVREKAGGRNRLHQGSVYGAGEPGPCCIEHHALIVKTPAERIAIQQNYARIAGKTWPPSTFEIEKREVQVADYTDGGIPFVVKRPRKMTVPPMEIAR